MKISSILAGVSIVNHKDNRTRLIVRDIASIDNEVVTVYGVSTNPNKPTYAHDIYARKGAFLRSLSRKMVKY